MGRQYEGFHRRTLCLIRGKRVLAREIEASKDNPRVLPPDWCPLPTCRIYHVSALNPGPWASETYYLLQFYTMDGWMDRRVVSACHVGEMNAGFMGLRAKGPEKCSVIV